VQSHLALFFRLFFRTLGCLAVLFVASTASANPIAPSLAPLMLHQRSSDLFDGLMHDLPAATQTKLTGAYVAFDPDLARPYSMIACDDDGDYVVVMSDAMIELAQRTAEAASADELTGSKKLTAYASTLAAQTTPGARLLPPPPGFYSGPHDPDHEGELFDQAIRGVLAHELSRLARGHLVCAHPSAAHEAADDVWTPSERAFAFKLSERLYDATHLADADAATNPWLRNRSQGYAALLDVLAIVEAGPGAMTIPQIKLHPNNAARATALRTV
jgi:hypothetical protein